MARGVIIVLLVIAVCMMITENRFRISVNDYRLDKLEALRD